MKIRILLRELALVLVMAISSGCQRETAPTTAPKTPRRVIESTLVEAIKVHGWDGLQGLAYLSGDGIPKNFAEARKWIRRSANQGAASAQNMMGNITQNDIKVARLSEAKSIFGNAYMWFSLAAAQGHEGAKESLANLESNSSADTLLAITKGQSLAFAFRTCFDKACWDYEPPVEREKLSFER
jgi:hypothetical protein